MVSDIRPNPGNDKAASCDRCGAELVCLSCGNHRDEALTTTVAGIIEGRDIIAGELQQLRADLKSAQEKIDALRASYEGLVKTLTRRSSTSNPSPLATASKEAGPGKGEQR